MCWIEAQFEVFNHSKVIDTIDELNPLLAFYYDLTGCIYLVAFKHQENNQFVIIGNYRSVSCDFISRYKARVHWHSRKSALAGTTTAPRTYWVQSTTLKPNRTQPNIAKKISSNLHSFKQSPTKPLRCICISQIHTHVTSTEIV